MGNNDSLMVMYAFELVKTSRVHRIAKLLRSQRKKSILQMLRGDGGETLLHYAVVANNLRMVKLLYDAGFDTSVRTTASYEYGVISSDELAVAIGHSSCTALMC